MYFLISAHECNSYNILSEPYSCVAGDRWQALKESRVDLNIKKSDLN